MLDVLGATLIGAEEADLWFAGKGAVDTPRTGHGQQDHQALAQPTGPAASPAGALIRCGRNDHLLRYVHTA